MSFLAGRLAATEGAFFSQNSKQAALALKQKLKSNPPAASSANPHSNPTPSLTNASQADVLPEVLRHSLPIGYGVAAELETASKPSPSSLASSLKLTLNPRRVAKDGIRRDGVSGGVVVEHLASVPQTTLGRRKWNIEAPEVSVVASTANDARVDVINTVDEKAMMEGVYILSKAFAIATGLVFGGSIIAAAVTSARLGIHSLDDIPTKGREVLVPRVEKMKQQLEPLKFWVDQKAQEWRLEESRRSSIGADYAKKLGVQQTQDGKGKSR